MYKHTIAEKLIKGAMTLQIIFTIILMLSVGTLVFMGGAKVIELGGVGNAIVYVGKEVKSISQRIMEDENPKPVTTD